MPIIDATPAAIEDAAQRLRSGELVAFPTETVYGLGADATNPDAVAKIFAAKHRPRFNPLIVHVADTRAAHRLADFSAQASELAKAFWPGPLTLVLPQKPENSIPEITTAGLATIALRIPSHPVAQALLSATARPVAAPSANRSGHVSATHATHVAADLGAHVSLILEAGPTLLGLESTVIDATTDELVVLRHGSITTEAIARATGTPPRSRTDDNSAPTSPGQLRSHYAPSCPVRLNATEVHDGEALLAFGPNQPDCAGPSINLSPGGNLREAAANLFAALRDLDQDGVHTIAVMPIPDRDLGRAINDRLERAAAAKPRSP